MSQKADFTAVDPNDVPEIRTMFSAFAIEGAELTYSVSGGKGKQARELIISNAP